MEVIGDLPEKWSDLGAKEVDDWLCARLKELSKSVGKWRPKRKREEGEKKIPMSLHEVRMSALVAHGYLESGDVVYCEIGGPKDDDSSEVVLHRYEGSIGKNGSLWALNASTGSKSFNTPSELSNYFYKQAAKAVAENPHCHTNFSAKTRTNGWTVLKYDSTDESLDSIRKKAWAVFSQKKPAI